MSPCPCPSRRAGRLVAHLPRRERPARPAEALGALRVAFAQRLRGERLAGDRLDLGIVLEPEGQRIHAAGLRHFVDGAFERDRACRLAGRAHEQRRADVGPHGLMRGGDGGARIERVRNVGGRLEEIVERARRRLGVMIERGQRRRHRRCRGARSAASARDGRPAEHLLAAQHQLDRPADQRAAMTPSTCGPEIMPFAAEAAAEKRAADVDLVRRRCRTVRRDAAAPSRGPGSACRSRACRRPMRRRSRAAPSDCDIAPASRRSPSIVLRRRRQARPRHRRDALAPECRRRRPAARSSRSLEPDAGRFDLVARREQAAPSVAASSVSAITTAIGWLA